MASNLKPIKVYGRGGPNPPKVAFVLEELGVPYEIEDVAFADIKGPEYLKVNPNGRIPAIYDPQTDLTIWESGAIVLYLIEQYDTDRKLSFKPESNEAYLAYQWLFFQVSGQGPYFGQAVWFKKYHPESVPSAVDRYVKEIGRVAGVLEGHLQKQKSASSEDGPWLVGGKCSYADIACLMWLLIAAMMLERSEYNPDDFPSVKEWTEKMSNRKAIRTVLERNEQFGH